MPLLLLCRTTTYSEDQCDCLQLGLGEQFFQSKNSYLGCSLGLYEVIGSKKLNSQTYCIPIKGFDSYTYSVYVPTRVTVCDDDCIGPGQLITYDVEELRNEER